MLRKLMLLILLSVQVVVPTRIALAADKTTFSVNYIGIDEQNRAIFETYLSVLGQITDSENENIQAHETIFILQKVAEKHQIEARIYTDNRDFLVVADQKQQLKNINQW